MRRDEPCGRGRALPALVGLAVLAGAGCRAPTPKVWNLRQVHHPDGRAKYAGDLQNDVEYVLFGFLDQTPIGRPEFTEQEEEAIRDPYRACLKNLNTLARCNRENRKTRALMVEMFAWLAGDCTYSLSRERCAIELGDLAPRVGAGAPLSIGEGEAAGADVVGEAATALFEDASPLVAGQNAPVMRRALLERCEAIQALTLDRDGARRLLSVTNLLLSRWRVERRESVEPLLVLHLDLERRCVALALAELLEDSDERVRAAGYRACIDAFGDRRAGLLEDALADPSPEVQLEAVRALARLGAPRPAPLPDAGEVSFEVPWIERVIELLSGGMGGPLAVASCDAMARLTGEPRDLHPERWILWWEDEGRAAFSGSPPGPSPAGSSRPGSSRPGSSRNGTG